MALEPTSTRPKTYRYETPIGLKERIVTIRKQTQKCTLKIHWQLEKEGIHIHARTVGNILKKEGLTRPYRVRKLKHHYTIQAIKTDNGAIFTNYCIGTNKRSDRTVKTIHALDRFCAEREIVHYLIDPGKPAQNGAVERSHREDEEKFYQRNRFSNERDLQKKLKAWNAYYNDLEHCGLNGKTPNQFLADYQLKNPPNVCT